MIRILSSKLSSSQFLRPAALRMYSVGTKATVAEEVKSPAHGSYHWNTERALSVVSVPLIGTAMIYGSIPMVDIALGFVMPAHIHMGFDTIIQDYFPKRRTPVLHSVFIWLLRFGTVLTLYGCYVINSKDVGITALCARLWTGKTAAGKKIE